MVPKAHFIKRRLALDARMARRLGGSGGVARLALEAMRSAYRELPGMIEAAARGVVDAITQFVHLSLLGLSGMGNAVTQRDALRERIKQHGAQNLSDSGLSVDAIAHALNCSRGQLYSAFAEAPDGVASCILNRSLQACRKNFDERSQAHRSITNVAFSFGVSNMAHLSRVFRSHLGMARNDYGKATLYTAAICFNHQRPHPRKARPASVDGCAS